MKFNIQSNMKSIVILILIALPMSWLYAADTDEKRIWLDDSGFDAPKAGKWWLSGTVRNQTDVHDGEYALEFPTAGARAVSNFPFAVAGDRPYIRMELWAKNLDSKASELLLKLDGRQRKTNQWLRTVEVSKADMSVGDAWQKLSMTFKVPEFDASKEYFKVELYSNSGHFLIDSVKAYSSMHQPHGNSKAVSQAEHFTPEADKRGKWVTVAKQGLPNVLIIGDSISIGYTRLVAANLQDKANVYRPIYPKGNMPINCGDTRLGLKDLKKWIAGHQWDVIHFNWGLHDLCYRHPDAKTYGRRDKINGTISVSLEQYEKNLDKLIKQLNSTGAKLIWASTTLVPAQEAGRFEGDEAKYNAVALKLAKQHNLAINDLHALTAQMDKSMFSGKGDVHYTAAGYKLLADHVTDSIKSQLTQ
tara:strand:+ start:1153 stop:2403 length:1251 start_codon:yes stop_codon:yes gene_type:complete